MIKFLDPEKFKENVFIKQLMNDSIEISKGRKVNVFDIEFTEKPNFSEYEFYIHNTGFYTSNLLMLFRQLEFAIEFLTNYNYGKQVQANRIDHLAYNIENYIIRISSVLDRTLQVINAVFHLCIHETHVNERLILKNLKVSRTKTHIHYNKLKSVVNSYSGDRNTIVHRHSYLHKEIRKLYLYYDEFLTKELCENDETNEPFILQRKKILTDFVVDKKKEFSKCNHDIYSQLTGLFDEMSIHYERLKRSLK